MRTWVFPSEPQFKNMKIRHLILALAALSSPAWGQQTPSFPVVSSFDGGEDGWASTSSDLIYRASGGSPDGFLGYQDQDPGGGLAVAPPKYLGNWSTLNGAGFLTFEFRIFETGNGSDLTANPYRVIITGEDGTTATWERENPGTSTNWVTFQIPLIASNWTLEGQSTWEEVLANVVDLRIKVEMFGNSGGATEKDRNGLDNVALVRRNPEDDCPELLIRHVPLFAFATEDNQQYCIELSSDGEQWNTLASFEGRGGIQFYTDRRLIGQRKFYRLVCKDGTEEPETKTLTLVGEPD